MDLKVKPKFEVPEGKHKGVIKEIKYRFEPFEYTDIIIELQNIPNNKGVPITLKYGCPTGLSEGSKLGKLIALFIPLNTGETINLESILLEKKIEFLTINEETKSGVFAEIVPKSIRKLE